MSDEADQPGQSPESADEYPLAPDGPSTPPLPLEFKSPDDVDKPAEPERFQFSLGELMLLMAATAVFFSIVKLLPGEPNFAKAAGLMGFVVLAAMVVMELVGVRRAILRVAWWTGLATYLLACVAAFFFG